MKEALVRIKEYFDPFMPATLEEWEELSTQFEIKEIEKKEELKRYGEKDEYLRFILKGAGAIMLQKGKREFCIALVYEDEFLTDFGSFTSQQASNTCITSFEPIRMVILHYNHLMENYANSHLAAHLGRVMVEREHQKMIEKQMAFIDKNAEERYLYLLKEKPFIFLRTPQYYIASYLGMSPESLSRIRKKMMRE